MCEQEQQLVFKCTGAGDVDGPLGVLLPDDEAGCSGLGLHVALRPLLDPRCWRDEVTLLGADGQIQRDWVSHA